MSTVAKPPTGFPGPRARLPIPEGFDTSALPPVDEARRLGLRKIVITYPTDKFCLEASKARAEANSARFPNLHWAELSRLHLQEQAQDLCKQCAKAGITVEFLPMVKLTSGRALDHIKISRVRFWAATQPPTDAAYFVFDDHMSKGTTVAGMLALLVAHGVPEDRLIRPVIANGLRPFKLTTEQKQGIAHLREHHRDTAAHVDAALNSIGVGGMDALTYDDAQYLGLYSATPSVAAVREKLDAVFDSREPPYEPIREPDRDYAEPLFKLLEARAPMGVSPWARK
jgi:hypothetical protein